MATTTTLQVYTVYTTDSALLYQFPVFNSQTEKYRGMKQTHLFLFISNYAKQTHLNVKTNIRPPGHNFKSSVLLNRFLRTIHLWVGHHSWFIGSWRTHTATITRSRCCSPSRCPLGPRLCPWAQDMKCSSRSFCPSTGVRSMFTVNWCFSISRRNGVSTLIYRRDSWSQRNVGWD